MTHFSRNPDALHADVDSEMVVLNPDTLRYYTFDEVAARVWALLGERPSTLDELCDALLADYDIDEASCRRDVAAFLEQAGAEGFVVET